MNNKHSFDVSRYYGTSRDKIDWELIEQTQLGMGWGESVAYDNRQQLIKVFQKSYLDIDAYNNFIVYDYADVLNIYRQWHNYWSQQVIHIDPKWVSWWDLLLSTKNGSSPNIIRHIIVKTLDLHWSTIDIHNDHDVCVLKNIDYIEWPSLQSLCCNSDSNIGYIYDTKDKRSVKVWAEQVYKLGYDISRYINEMIFNTYGIYCGKIMLSFTKYGHTALVPKNIKCTWFDQETGTLSLTITDWCSSIMLWYILNHKRELFQAFLETWDLVIQNMNIFKKASLTYDNIKHRIARSYVHKY